MGSAQDHLQLDVIKYRIQAAESKLNGILTMPRFVREIEILGVRHCIIQLRNGSTRYYGSTFYHWDSNANYPALQPAPAASVDVHLLQKAVMLHREGLTSWHHFVCQAVDAGAVKCMINVQDRTIVFLDVADNILIVRPVLDTVVVLN